MKWLRWTRFAGALGAVYVIGEHLRDLGKLEDSAAIWGGALIMKEGWNKYCDSRNGMPLSFTGNGGDCTVVQHINLGAPAPWYAQSWNHGFAGYVDPTYYPFGGGWKWTAHSQVTPDILASSNVWHTRLVFDAPGKDAAWNPLPAPRVVPLQFNAVFPFAPPGLPGPNHWAPISTDVGPVMRPYPMHRPLPGVRPATRPATRPQLAPVPVIVFPPGGAEPPGPPGRPPVRPRPPRNRKPDRKTRERKYRAGKTLTAIMAGIRMTTEFMDMFEVLWKSLSDKLKQEAREMFDSRYPSPMERWFWAITHLSDVDMVAFVRNYIDNEVEDRSGGFKGKVARKVMQKFHADTGIDLRWIYYGQSSAQRMAKDDRWE